MGSLLSGTSTSGAGILGVLAALFGAMNGGSNPLGNLAGLGNLGDSTSSLGALGSVIGASNTISNGSSGLNTERASYTTGATPGTQIPMPIDPTQIGFGRKSAK